MNKFGKKKRLIPVLLIKNGWVVQSYNFKEYKNIGSPIASVKRLSEFASDEIIILDITENNLYDLNRSEVNYKNPQTIEDIIKEVSKICFMPMSIGGKINSLNKIEEFLRIGADKVILNTMALKETNFISKASKQFGSQCIIVSIDFKETNNEFSIFNRNINTKINSFDYIQKIIDAGAGEIFINFVDRDGNKSGYEIDFISKITEKFKIPIISCGGAGKWDDMYELLNNTNSDAVAAANIFHHYEHSVYIAKKFLYDKGVFVREPKFIKL